MEVIQLDQVSLWRRTQEEFSYDLKRTVLSLIEGKFRKPSRKQVLQNINLTIYQGEKIGIIGANGSGKSTLLKAISGILQPTSGKVRVKGSIAPLIELGAGFEPELPVADNIIFYGVLLGFSRREMKSRIGSILAFAELQEYERVPVKGLSSGMTARLAFAIATDIHPDILIIDEVLSVGDEKFKQKSKQKMNELWNDKTTVLVVSHSMEFIQESCSQVLWIDQGRIRLFGKAHEVIHAYLGSL
ncbi:MAG: ATP-binding protein [Leptolyngbya sp.]|nr:MAG: ATP-binding protein [Leptolyngbya sp.]